MPLVNIIIDPDLTRTSIFIQLDDLSVIEERHCVSFKSILI